MSKRIEPDSESEDSDASSSGYSDIMDELLEDTNIRNNSVHDIENIALLNSNSSIEKNIDIAEKYNNYAVAHFYGYPFLKDCFSDIKRRDFGKYAVRGTNKKNQNVEQHINKHLHSDSSYNQKKKEINPYTTLNKDQDDQLTSLDRKIGQQLSYINKVNETYFNRLIQQYVNTFCSKPDNFYNLINNTTRLEVSASPIISTSKTPEHAFKFALAHFENDKKKVVDPQYNKDGIPKHMLAGMIFITLHKLGEYNAENKVDITQLIKTARILSDCHYLHQLEVAFLGGIIEGQIVAAVPVIFPNLSKDHAKTGSESLFYQNIFKQSFFNKNNEISKKHGSPEFFREEIAKKHRGGYINRYCGNSKCFNKGIVGKLKEAYTKIAIKIAQKKAEDVKCKLVYIDPEANIQFYEDTKSPWENIDKQISKSDSYNPLLNIYGKVWQTIIKNNCAEETRKKFEVLKIEDHSSSNFENSDKKNQGFANLSNLHSNNREELAFKYWHELYMKDKNSLSIQNLLTASAEHKDTLINILKGEAKIEGISTHVKNFIIQYLNKVSRIDISQFLANKFLSNTNSIELREQLLGKLAEHEESVNNLKLQPDNQHQDATEFLEPLFSNAFGMYKIITNIACKNQDEVDQYHQKPQIKEEPTAIIQLEINKSNKFSQLLASLNKTEDMKGDNKVEFEKIDGNTKVKIDTVKTTKTIIPDNRREICFSIKRFGNDLAKINDLIEFDQIKVNEQDYEITAFIRHTGSLNSGHYIAYVKENDGKWYSYNDAQRDEVNTNTLDKAKEDANVVKYSVKDDPSLLPNKQEGIKNNTGARCWLNSSVIFTKSFTTLKENLTQFIQKSVNISQDPELLKCINPQKPLNIQEGFSSGDIEIKDEYKGISDTKEGLNLESIKLNFATKFQ